MRPARSIPFVLGLAMLAAVALVAGRGTDAGVRQPDGAASPPQSSTAAATPALSASPTGCGVSLQARIDATPSGGTVDLSGCRFVLSSSVTISRPMTVRGGTVTASADGVRISASDVTVTGVTFLGPGDRADNDHVAILVHGSGASDYLTNIALTRNSISGWDGEGIHLDFVDGFTIADNQLSDIWYAGIGCYSARNGHITANTVRRVVGTGNAYGVYLSRSYGGGIERNPRSTDVVVSGNTIEDIPNWEGLDTHAGQRIQFLNNTIRRVRNAIMVGGSTDASGGPDLLAPLDVTVSGNVLDSGVTNGTLDVGIYFLGANKGRGIPGSSTQLATGGVISDNTITGYGTQSDGEYAAIKISDTSGLRIAGNRITDASPTGIQVYVNNYGFSVSGNTIQDPWSNSLGYAYGVYVHGDYNVGAITGNTFVRGARSAASVLTSAVIVNAYPHNKVTLR